MELQDIVFEVGDILEPGYEAFSREELEELLAAVRPYIPGACLRGTD